MPPVDRIVPCFAAEPPQGPPPDGAWGKRLEAEFLGACRELEDSELGVPGPVQFFPDRTWSGRTYVPAVTTTSAGLEIFGVVSFRPAFDNGDEPEAFHATADWTDETPANNPEWNVDICDEVVGGWRGQGGETAAMTLVWGTPIGVDAAVATAELDGLVVDQSAVAHDRFTLLAPDAYRGATLEVALYGASGAELVRESLYAEEDE